MPASSSASHTQVEECSASAVDAPAVACTFEPVQTAFCEVLLQTDPELTVPRLVLKARKAPIDDDGVRRVLDALDSALARGKPLTIAYDLRGASLPSRKQISLGLEWISRNSPLLDQYLQGIAIVLLSPWIRGIVSFVLHITQPPQPTMVCADEDAAYAFARDQCTEIRQWVSNRRKKRGGAAGNGDDGSSEEHGSAGATSPAAQ